MLKVFLISPILLTHVSLFVAALVCSGDVGPWSDVGSLPLSSGLSESETSTLFDADTGVRAVGVFKMLSTCSTTTGLRVYDFFLS